jgi:hypothetical protein
MNAFSFLLLSCLILGLTASSKRFLQGTSSFCQDNLGNAFASGNYLPDPAGIACSSSFYSCDGTTDPAQSMNCPGVLYFSVDSTSGEGQGFCDWPWLALGDNGNLCICSTGVAFLNTWDATSTTLYQCDENGVFQQQSNYICYQAGVVVDPRNPANSFSCAAADQSIALSVPTSSAASAGSTPTVISAPIPSISSSCGWLGELLPNPNDCNSYIQCDQDPSVSWWSVIADTVGWCDSGSSFVAANYACQTGTCTQTTGCADPTFMYTFSQLSPSAIDCSNTLDGTFTSQYSSAVFSVCQQDVAVVYYCCSGSQVSVDVNGIPTCVASSN